MAKKGKKTERAPSGEASGGDRDRAPLADALLVFARGDYARARALLAQKVDDPSLAEGAKAQARELLEATKMERGAFLTGLACAGFYGLVLLVTSLFQP
jgi:hypothetical protein